MNNDLENVEKLIDYVISKLTEIHRSIKIDKDELPSSIKDVAKSLDVVMTKPVCNVLIASIEVLQEMKDSIIEKEKFIGKVLEQFAEMTKKKVDKCDCEKCTKSEESCCSDNEEKSTTTHVHVIYSC